MMKDKLTKNHLSNFDKICIKLRRFSVALIILSVISFIPLSQKFTHDLKVLDTEIVALKEQNDYSLVNIRQIRKIDFSSSKRNFKEHLKVTIA